MSFLQPILLLVLVAAGIPLILHLLTLRKLKVVPFSTLAFLKELQRSRVRAVRLRQLLLLILRTLLILLIVMAFARPAFRGRMSPLLAGASGTDALIILDDSYSMSMRDPDGSFLRQAVAAAHSILDGLGPEDNVSVIPLSTISSGRGGAAAQWVSPLEASDQLGSVTLSSIHVPLETAIRFAADALDERTSINRELYIISDFQQGLLRSNPASEALFDETVRAVSIRIGSPANDNMSLTSVECLSTIVETDIPALFDLRIRNHVSDAPRTANISLFVESQRLDQRVLNLNGGEERQVELRGAPQRSGFLTGSFLLDGDDTEFDNTYWFVLRIPSERRILVVGDAQETFHTTLALSTSRREGRSGFRITRVSPDRLSAALLKENDVYVLFDRPLRDDLRRTLAEQIGSGKGAILVPSPDTDPGTSGRSGAAELGSPFTGGRTTLADGSFLAFGRTDLEHPLFEGMFAPRSTPAARTETRLESPDIFSYAGHNRPTGGRSILDLSNGDPFLTEFTFGSGRVLTYAVSFMPEWSTFPVTGLFVPLIHRSVMYVSGDRIYRTPIEPGQEIDIPLAPTASAALRLRAPDGSETPVQPIIRPTGPVFQTRQAVIPGIYSLMAGEQEIDRFAVNLSVLESDPTTLSSQRILAVFGPFGIAEDRASVIESGDDLADRVYAARVGTELWPLLLALALIVALVETWLAGTMRAETQDGRTQ